MVEAEGVHHLLTFAEMTGAHVYIVHLSCTEALREALRGRERGVNVWVETLIQYLLLDRTDAEKPDFRDRRRSCRHRCATRPISRFLWKGLRQGTVSSLATDHAPFDFATQKIMGATTSRKSPTASRRSRIGSTSTTPTA